MKKAIILIVAVQFCSVVMGQTDSKSSRLSLQGLTGVYVLVDKPHPDAEQDGLSSSQIQTDVELRLRTAGIKVLTMEEMLKAPGMPTLYVYVSTLKRQESYSYSVEVILQQNVRLDRDPTGLFIAPTWKIGAVGAVGAANINQIRNGVRDELDRFINAYFSVNPKDPQNTLRLMDDRQRSAGVGIYQSPRVHIYRSASRYCSRSLLCCLFEGDE